MSHLQYAVSLSVSAETCFKSLFDICYNLYQIPEEKQIRFKEAFV